MTVFHSVFLNESCLQNVLMVGDSCLNFIKIHILQKKFYIFLKGTRSGTQHLNTRCPYLPDLWTTWYFLLHFLPPLCVCCVCVKACLVYFLQHGNALFIGASSPLAEEHLTKQDLLLLDILKFLCVAVTAAPTQTVCFRVSDIQRKILMLIDGNAFDYCKPLHLHVVRHYSI